MGFWYSHYSWLMMEETGLPETRGIAAMRHVLTIVEQLDRAAMELTTDHPINNRLALILIDNATEIILHRQCSGRLEFDKVMSRLSSAMQSIVQRGSSENDLGSSEDSDEPHLTPKQRAQAGGKSLDGKLKVLEYLGDISGTERRFIAIAHEYRNELYHVGLSHDHIIRAIAGHYFLLCCDLFVRMANGGGFFSRVYSSDDEYTEVARRYFPTAGPLAALSVDNDTLAEKLRCALPSAIPSLAETLADSARQYISEIVDNCAFLVRDNPFGYDESEILETAQWLRDIADALEREDIDGIWADPNYRDNYFRVAIKLKATWEQRHTKIPTARWMRRANAIEQESNPLVAMDLYQLLRNDMSYLEDSIQSAAEELDQWIQHETDKRRGK